MEGDKDAFRYFFDKYYVDLCNFVHVYVNDKNLSEEIVQDIFVYFWENKEKIQIQVSVKSYLFSASKRQSLNLLRNNKNRKRILETLGDFAPMETSLSDSVLDTIEFREILDAAIDQLAPKCKEIFLLSKREELSNKEIAERLDISVKTVENQMTIALRKLRDYLLPYREKIFILFLLNFFS